MPKLPIEHGDSGELARNKINESWNDLLKNVEGMKPHIENGYWWIWDINTNVRARGEMLEFRVHEWYIQCKSESSKKWSNVVPIDDLRGKALTFDDLTQEQKKELKWEQWISISNISHSKNGGETTVTFHLSNDTSYDLVLKDWESSELRKTDTHIQRKLQGERAWKNLIPLADITWPAGSGSGDMLKSENLSWLTNKEQARSNLDVYSKAEVSAELNKKSNTAHNHDSAYYKKTEVDGKLGKKADLINGLIPSSQLPSYVDDVLEYNTRAQFPTTWEKGKIYIAINDDSQWRWTGTAYKKMVSSPWSTDAIPEGSQNLYFTEARAKGAVQSDLNAKADLVGGKVPASQLPEVSQIDESNLVHKSWDEVIRWNKTFKDAPSLATDIGWDTNIVLRKFHDVRWSKIRILFKRWSWTSENPRPANVWDVMGAINFEDAVEWNSYFGIEVRKWQGKGKAIISESDLHIWWKRPIDIHVNDQNRTGERQSRTPTCGSSTITKHHCRYKVIGKTCYFLVEVYINNVQWETPWFTLPVVRKNYNTEFPISGYCSRRWENPVKDSRWVLSFNGSNRIATLNSVDMWVLIQSWEYIVRANWCYEIE